MHSTRQKTVLITGASRGIGLCAATELKARGYRVFATVRKAEDLVLLQTLGFEVERLDLADTFSMDQAVKNILEKTEGHLDALINNAGYLVMGAVEDLPLEMIKEQFETNFFGTIYLTKKIIPIMRKQKEGRIIFISSINGFIGVPYAGAYCASKFALEGIVESLAMELYGSHLHVSLIQPGFIATELRKSVSTIPNREKSLHQSKYDSFLASTKSSLKEREKLPFIQLPTAVVKKIIHALETKRPKFRYRVTLFAHLMRAFKCILPNRMQIKIMSKS